MLFVVPYTDEKDVSSIVNVARAMGWQIFNEGWTIPERLRNLRGAAYGGEIFSNVIAKQMNWATVSNPMDWLVHLPFEYTNRQISVMTVSEARRLEEPKFIRSVDYRSMLKAGVLEGKDLPKELDGDTKMLVSDVMKFTSEYRLYVRNKTVVASCCYWLRSRPMVAANQEAEFNLPKNYDNNRDAIIGFVNGLLRDERVKCVDNCVINVARFDKDRYTVLNSKPAYAADPFGCELTAVFDVIKHSFTY